MRLSGRLDNAPKAGTFVGCLTVIPAKAGIYRQYEAWIPACAGMTVR
jgi:hypothetical protein